MKVENVDIVCGLAWGDEAKGKIVSHLINVNKYDWVCRWSGGSNAGHTIYKDTKKYVTHIVPAGILYGIKSYIGPECYINIKSLLEELNYLKMNGFDTSKLFISPQAHIITEEHRDEDNKFYKEQQGSTGSGIAPCARDKYARKGTRIWELDTSNLFKEHNTDILFHTLDLAGNILCEGAQGIWLDINHGNYPFVTSSLTLPYSACSLGFPPQKIGNIYGASKIYDTRVGIDPSFKEDNTDENLKKICTLGAEFGATTNRRRNINWLDLDKLVLSINMTGCTIVVISKIDIIKSLKVFKLNHLKELKMFDEFDKMKNYINTILYTNCEFLTKIIYSDNPYQFDL